MIAPVQETNNIILETNADAAQRMQIELSGKAFKVLTMGLYADPIKAIVRELSTNAWDAHIEAGNADKNFDIQLPTLLEPIFCIRDYGTGIAEEVIFNRYFTLFGSNKTHTNELNGMLGLGSKVPFSYTDQVTVCSIQDGTEKIYTGVMGADGIPTFRKVHEHGTEEEDGFKVQFAVKSEDCRHFQDACESVFMAFRTGPQPNILNTPLKGRDFRDTLTKRGEGLYTEGVVSFAPGRLFVIQGNVIYPVELQLLPEHLEREFGTVLRGYNYFVEVPIGTVDFVPSREALTGTEENYEKLVPYIQKVSDYFMDMFRAEYAHIDTELAALVALHRGGSEGNLFSETFFLRVMREKGLDIQANRYTWVSPDVSDLVEELGIERQKLRVRDDTRVKMVRTSNGTFLSLDVRLLKQVRIVEVNDTLRYRSKIRSYYAGDAVILFVVKKASTAPNALQKLKELLPPSLITWVKTSDMPDAVHGSSTTPRKRVRHRWFGELYGAVSGKSLKTLEDLGVDKKKPFYYVRQSAGSLYGRPSSCTVTTRKLSGLLDLGLISSTQVVAIPASRDEALVKDTFPNAKNFFEHIKNSIRARWGLEEILELSRNTVLPGNLRLRVCQNLFGSMDDAEASKYRFGREARYYLTQATSSDYTKLRELIPDFISWVYGYGTRSSIPGEGGAFDEFYVRLTKDFPIITCISPLDYDTSISRPEAIKVRDSLLRLLKKEDGEDDE